MTRATFQECLKLRVYLEKLKNEVDLNNFGLEKLLIRIKDDGIGNFGVKILRSVLLSIGITIERRKKKEKNEESIVIKNLEVTIKELVSVVNHLTKEINEVKCHAFASRQYVCDLAEQLGVTFEQHNKVIANGRL